MTGDIQLVPEDTEEPSITSFVLGEVIGRGGFGLVQRVTKKTQVGEFDYAMKMLEPSIFVQDTERAEARFRREMAALRKLQHRGIVPILEAGKITEDKPYILMPLIEGKNLRDSLSGAEPARVLRAFDEILLALEFAHSQGVIHRDLKPSNVLLRTSDEQPIILDFGCAYLIDDLDESLTSQFIGTYAYVPPEVHRNHKLRTPKQDVYSCGVMLYEVICRRLPRPEDYEPIEPIFDGYAGIDEVIEKALAPERTRLASAKAMREKLRELMAALGE